MARQLEIAWLYFLQALKTRLEYRADFFIECFASLLQQAAGFLTLWVMFQNIHGLKGWTWEEVLFIYGFSLLPRALFDAFAMGFYGFSDRYIVQGEMDRCLLRPLSTLLQVMLEGLSFEFLSDLVLALGILIYASTHMHVSFNWAHYLLAFLFVLGGFGVLMGVFLALTSLSFWSQDRVQVVPTVYNLLDFARYPLNIFNRFVSFLLTFLIPFGFIAYYPSSALLGKGEESWLAYAAPLAGLLCMLVAGMLWRAGQRNYAGAGS